MENIEEDFFLQNLDQGIDTFFTTEMLVSSIHLYSENYQGSKAFKDELPFKLSFGKSRKDANTLLGEPMVSGGGYDDDIFGHIDLWDKYYYNSYSLHLRYDKKDKKIILITLGSLKFEDTIIAE